MMLRTAPACLVALLAIAAPAIAADEPPTLPMTYVGFGAMTVPVIDDYRPLGFLQTRIALHVEDRNVRARLSSTKPMMTDEYIRTLAEFTRLRVDPSRPVNVRRLRDALQAATNRLVPGGQAQVLILEAAVRRS